MSDESLIHASYAVGHYDRDKYNSAKSKTAYQKTSSIIGRRSSEAKITKRKYGNYASPYYDPVARHERYMRERSSLGIGKGLSLSSGGSGRGGSGSKGKSSKGSKGSKGRGGGGKGSAANIAAEIEKLREESSLNTEAQREAARRKIEDLKAELKAQIEVLSGREADDEEGVNTAEIRGRIQSIREEIEHTGGDLQKWITQEKEALERRIAAVYNSNGKQYKITSQSDKKNASEARDKEVKSRADSIYKKKS